MQINNFKFISIQEIEIKDHQIKSLTEENLIKRQQLLESIKHYGVINPIVVYLEEDSEKYIVIDGHTRMWCAEQLNLKQMPCNIAPKQDIEFISFGLNDSVGDLSYLDSAISYEKMLSAFGGIRGAQQKLADYLGIDKRTVSKHMKILEELKNKEANIEELRTKNLSRSKLIKLLKDDNTQKIDKATNIFKIYTKGNSIFFNLDEEKISLLNEEEKLKIKHKLQEFNNLLS